MNEPRTPPYVETLNRRITVAIVVIGVCVVIGIAVWPAIARRPSATERTEQAKAKIDAARAIAAYDEACKAEDRALAAGATEPDLVKVDAMWRAAGDLEGKVDRISVGARIKAPEDLTRSFAELSEVSRTCGEKRAALSQARWEHIRDGLPPITRIFAPSHPDEFGAGKFDTKNKFYHYNESILVSDAAKNADLWENATRDPECVAVLEGRSVRIVRSKTLIAGTLHVDRPLETILVIPIDDFEALSDIRVADGTRPQRLGVAGRR